MIDKQREGEMKLEEKGRKSAVEKEERDRKYGKR